MRRDCRVGVRLICRSHRDGTLLAGLPARAAAQVRAAAPGQAARSPAERITSEAVRHGGTAAVPQQLRPAPNHRMARPTPWPRAGTARRFGHSFRNRLPVRVDGRSLRTPHTGSAGARRAGSGRPAPPRPGTPC
jgi:hypothetical protein